MAKLTTRFGHNRFQIQARGNVPLTEQEIALAVPSAFALGKHESRSERYTYIPTVEVIRGLAKEGFKPFFAAQSKSRIEGKTEYTKHMIRLRHESALAKSDVNEIIMINSHDGTSKYQMLAGAFRFVCCNGLICGDILEDVRIPHTGNVVGDVIDGAFRILSGFEQVEASKDAMKALVLPEGAQRAFANAALAVRYPDKTEAPVSIDSVLVPRRYEDRDSTLWTTFQRVQENLVDGGLRTNDRRRRTHTRAITGIDGNVAVNRGLWILAEEMRRLASSQAAA